jgi:hypothetical protein
VEFCTALHEEHLVNLELMKEGVCFSPYSLKLTTVVLLYLSPAILLARKDVEVHLHAPYTKTEHFWLCEWVNCHLKKLYYYYYY